MVGMTDSLTKLVSNWPEFKELQTTLAFIGPGFEQKDRKPKPVYITEKDREVTYKQFSIDAAEFSKSDAEATLDVREATEGYNTIYQLKSLGATEYPHIYWTENLKGGIEYQLSCYVKAATATEASLRYAHTVLPEIAGTQTFDLNKGEILNDVIIGKITPLATDWKKSLFASLLKRTVGFYYN